MLVLVGAALWRTVGNLLDVSSFVPPYATIRRKRRKC